MSYSLAELGEINKGLFSRFAKPARQARKATRASLRANKEASKQRAIDAGATHPGLFARGESASLGAMNTASAKATDWVNNPDLDQRVHHLGSKATEGLASKVPELSTAAGHNAATAAKQASAPSKRKLLTYGITGGAGIGAGTATVPWVTREVKRRKQQLTGSESQQPSIG